MASTSIAPPPNGPGPSSGGEPLAGHNSKQPTFEFTRRKRWAELLVNELSEAITLVLSPVGKILFCGPAVTELLGWRDEELIDGDLLELVNVDDQAAFRQTLAGAIQAHTDVVAYVRLRCKNPNAAFQSSPAHTAHAVAQHARDVVGDYGYAIPTASTSSSVAPQPPPLALSGPSTPAPKEVLFELTGYPHFVDPDEAEEQELAQHGMMIAPQCKVVFAVAKPYPSRNTAMLNTFLELKVENERLQQRIADLRSNKQPVSARRASAAQSYPQPPQLQRRPSLSPIITHPYSHTGVTPSPATANTGGYGSVPVSMAVPVSSLSNAGYAPPTATTYAPSSASFYAPPQQSYADYGVGLGLGVPQSPAPGAGAYAFPGPSAAVASGLNALAMASGLASAATDHRRMSLSAPAGATDHRRMSIPGVDGSAREGNGGREREDGEEGGKKKKARRHVGEQFVCRTCGRTDSPEWRKGPLGPKTLCNACGLRWAKQVRKGEDKDEHAAGGE